MSSSSPSGSRKIWCDCLSANRTILSSIEGQYLGPTPSICPPYIADRERLSRMIWWVVSLVWVIPQAICRASGALDRKEKSVGSSSPGWLSSRAQSIVRPSRRGGVPVFRRPRGKSKPCIRSANAIDGASPMRPAAKLSSPIRMRPRRNVPLVRITVCARTSSPFARRTPLTTLPSRSRSTTSPARTVRLSCCAVIRCTAARYKARSA